MGTAAACSKVSLPGFGTNLSGFASTSSATEPWAMPITSSPGRKPGILPPTASTVPATSPPGTLASTL